MQFKSLLGIIAGAATVLLYAILSGVIDYNWDRFLARSVDGIMGSGSFFFLGPFTLLTCPFVVALYVFPLAWLLRRFMREGRRMWFAIVVSMSLTFVVSHVAYGEYRLSYGDATFGYIVLSMLWVLGGSVIGIAELLFFESWRNSKRAAK